MVLCLAASYSPDPEQPLGLGTALSNLAPARSRRLSGHAGSRLIHCAVLPPARTSWLALKGLWIDVGNRDQYFIQYGTRALADRLEASSIDHQF